MNASLGHVLRIGLPVMGLVIVVLFGPFSHIDGRARILVQGRIVGDGLGDDRASFVLGAADSSLAREWARLLSGKSPAEVPTRILSSDGEPPPRPGPSGAYVDDDRGFEFVMVLTGSTPVSLLGHRYGVWSPTAEDTVNWLVVLTAAGTTHVLQMQPVSWEVAERNSPFYAYCNLGDVEVPVEGSADPPR